MTEYLGISMVVIVVTMCIAVLSTLVTGNILKEIEAHRRRSWDRWWAGLGKFIAKLREDYKDDIDNILEKTNSKNGKKVMKRYDDVIDLCHKKGIKVDDIDLDK